MLVTLATTATILAMAVLPATAQGREDDPARRSLTLVGEAEMSAVPDMALVTLGVTREAETAAAALEANSAAMRAVLDTVRAAGIEEREVQTSGLSLQPRFVYPRQGGGEQPPRLIGYTASNQVTLRLRDLGKLGALLDRLVAAGANDIRGIGFDLADRSRLLDEARRKAVQDAKRRASLVAEAAGVALGEIMSIAEEDGIPAPRPMASRAMAAEAAVPVEAGELTLRARVRIVWRIAD